nr:hypothetical protein pmam_183 [Pithovirus mammoth]
MSLKVKDIEGELYFILKLNDEAKIRMHFPSINLKWKKLLQSIEENFDYRIRFQQGYWQSYIEHSNGVVDFSIKKNDLNHEEICVSIKASKCIEALKFFTERV